MKIIDLRSDTVTQPTQAMRKAMATAEVGDDVFGDDPTVNRLEALAAQMLGTESALFVPSGVQSNLLALLVHCERGDEYIVGQNAHTYKYEGGGAAMVGGIQPQPIDFSQDGTLPLDQIAKVIKPDDFHFARTRLLCLENTQGGKVLPLDYLKEATDFARNNGLNCHLDGARLFNATVKLEIDVQTISQHFDSISICLSKGLGAPVGSLLCGRVDFIKQARRWRKTLGGGMRQSGILAAAGIIALTDHVARLTEDHANAILLAERLSEIEGIEIDLGQVQTNMVFVSLKQHKPIDLQAYLDRQSIKISHGNPIRLVTHLDIAHNDVLKVSHAMTQFFSR